MLDDLGIDKLKELVSNETPAIVTTNRLFIEGDHWQGGSGWIGPRPAPTETGAMNTLAELQRGFTSSNKIAEVAGRHAEGVIGREPAWSFVPIRPMEDDEEPDESEQTLIDELEAALTNWWNKRDVHNWLLSMSETMTWAERGGIRLYIPSGRLQEQQVQQAEGLEGALDNIFLEHPRPEGSLLYQDPITGEYASIIIYTPKPLPGEQEGKEQAEVSFQSETDPLITIVRVITESDKQEFPLPLGGRLIFWEARRELLVTEQIQQNQRALNLSLSMLPRNVITGGFLERMMLNAQQPGVWDLDAGGQPIPGTFKPHNFRTGAGTSQFIAGIVDVNEQTGAPTRSNPEVVIREPVPVTSSVDAVRAHEYQILNEAKQLHVLMNDDAEASGLSRREARIDYVGSLMRTQPGVQVVGRWLMETVLAMAEAILNSPGKYTDKFRCNFVCRLNAGSISAEEQQQNLTAVEKGMMPKELAMALNGIDDVDAAIAQINQTPEAQITLLQKRAEVIKILTDAGASIEAAAQVAGLEQEHVTVLARSAQEVQDQEAEEADEEDTEQEEEDEGAAS